jgi:hypothetical protein
MTFLFVVFGDAPTNDLPDNRNIFSTVPQIEILAEKEKAHSGLSPTLMARAERRAPIRCNFFGQSPLPDRRPALQGQGSDAPE